MIAVGQVVARWWQRYVAGAVRRPSDLGKIVAEDDPWPVRAVSDGPPVDPVDWQAPERLAVPSFLLSTGHLSQHERANWHGVDPRLMYWAALFVEYARKQGVPLYVHTALRDKAAQEAVRRAGHSKAPFGRSAHNIGEAVDVVHGLYHWDMTRQEWALLHVLGLRALERVNARLRAKDKLHLTWGGDFKSLYDPAHWEISDYRSRLSKAQAMSVGPAVHMTPRRILKEAVKWAILK